MHIRIAILLLFLSFIANAETKTSYLWGIHIPSLVDPKTQCCHDLDNDGFIDDGLGSTLALMYELNGNNYQEKADRHLLQNLVVKAITWINLDLNSKDAAISFNVSNADINNPNISLLQRIVGFADLTVDPAAGDAFSGTIVNGYINATGELLEDFLLIEGPFGNNTLNLYDVRIEGQLTEDTLVCNGVCSENNIGAETLIGGLKLSGLIPADEIFMTLNEQYRHCACAGVDPNIDLLSWADNTSTQTVFAQCNQTDLNGSNCVVNDFCYHIETVCKYAPVIGSAFDVDTNNNKINDAFAVGLRLGVSGVDDLTLVDLIFADDFE